MRLLKPILVASVSAFVVGGVCLTSGADETPTTRPAAGAATSKPARPKMSAKLIKLTKPWSEVADLTDDQKQQLYEIHEDYKAKLKALDVEEREQSEAVLTDAQKAALGEKADADKADKKIKAAEQRAALKEAKAAKEAAAKEAK